MFPHLFRGHGSLTSGTCMNPDGIMVAVNLTPGSTFKHGTPRYYVNQKQYLRHHRTRSTTLGTSDSLTSASCHDTVYAAPVV